MFLEAKQNIITFLLFCILTFTYFASSAQTKKEKLVTYNVIVNNDTIAQFELPEVTVIPPYKFKSKSQKRKYSRLVRYIKKVYPYAKLANEMLSKINDNIDSLDSKKVAKKYIKEVDKELQKRYGKELKKLTVSQGRLLIKLIARETGSTSYELIKELRGAFPAFMWQSLARLFGENLKVKYDKDDEDKMIEHIVLMIEAGQL
jgi:hypothetical protein